MESLDGTGYLGSVAARYDRLCQVFGPPSNLDGDKVKAEWVVATDNGSILTIYDYKSGTIPVSKVTKWHVGGRDLGEVEEFLKGKGLELFDKG